MTMWSANNTKHSEDPSVVVFDRTSIMMLKLRASHSDYAAECRRPIVHVRRNCVSQVLRGVVLSPEEAWKRLRKYEQALQNEVRQRLVGHTRYFWLHLSRRSLPTREQDDDLHTATLGSLIFNLAIMKWGKDGADDVSWEDGNFGTPTWFPLDIDYPDVLDMSQAYFLSLELSRVHAKMRSVAKGKRARVNDALEFELLPHEQVDAAIALYERRGQRYRSVFAMEGFATEFQLSKEGKRPFVWWPRDNWEEIKAKEAMEWWRLYMLDIPGWPNVSNFVLLPIHYEPIHQAFAYLGSDVRRYLGCDGVSLSAALYGLFLRSDYVCRKSSGQALQIWQRGYGVHQGRDSLVDQVAEFTQLAARKLGQDVAVDDATQAADRLLRHATYQEPDFKRIDLWERGPVKLILDLEDLLIIDYTMLPLFLCHLFRNLTSRGGSLGNKRGKAFEKHVREIVAEEVGEGALWRCEKKLHPTTEKGDATPRDIDVSFTRGEALFVIECGSKVVSAGYDQGRPEDIERRKEDVIRRKLRQADSLAEMLVAHPTGANYSLPEGTQCIISLACSPFTEYIDEFNDYYMLTDSIPRICTPPELVQFIKTFDIRSHIGKPYCYEVRR